MTTLKFDVENLIPSHIKTLAQMRKENVHKCQLPNNNFSIILDKNESHFGSVGTEKRYNLYPDQLATALRNELCSYHKNFNVQAQQIVVGNGSTELVEVVLRSILLPLEKVILIQPLECIWKETVLLHNAQSIEIGLDEEHNLPFRRIYDLIDEQTKAIVLANPNPYFGTLISYKELARLAEQFNGIIVVDESYIDCEPEQSLLSLLDQYANIVIIQTFSKIWGLAALRIGVAYMHEDFAKIVQYIKPPFSVNQVAQEHALRALFLTDYKNVLVKDILEQRHELIAQLQSFSFVEKILPAHANFITIYVKDAEYTYEHLLQEGIQVALLKASTFYVQSALRITIGTAEENQQLLRALKEIEVQNSSIKRLFSAIAGTLTKVGVLVGLVRKMF